MIYCKTKLASLTPVACFKFYFVVSQCGHCSSSHNDVAVWREVRSAQVNGGLSERRKTSFTPEVATRRAACYCGACCSRCSICVLHRDSITWICVVNSLIRESIDACSAGGCVNEDGGAEQVATLTVDAGARFWIAKKKP